MKATVNIPAYRALRTQEAYRWQDYPARTVDLNFPGFPPEGLHISVMAQDAEGTWQHGVVEVTKVKADPGWKLPSNKPPKDGYWHVEVSTVWIDHPGKKVYRSRG